MRILVVEDYEPVRVATIRSLREEGYSVDGANDFEEASYYVSGTDYDAVVLDIVLPGGSGLDVLRRLRARGKATPVLLLTARDTVEDRIEGLDTGAMLASAANGGDLNAIKAQFGKAAHSCSACHKQFRKK